MEINLLKFYLSFDLIISLFLPIKYIIKITNILFILLYNSLIPHVKSSKFLLILVGLDVFALQ